MAYSTDLYFFWRSNEILLRHFICFDDVNCRTLELPLISLLCNNICSDKFEIIRPACRWLIVEFSNLKEIVESWLVYGNTFSWIIQSNFLTETDNKTKFVPASFSDFLRRICIKRNEWRFPRDIYLGMRSLICL